MSIFWRGQWDSGKIQSPPRRETWVIGLSLQDFRQITPSPPFFFFYLISEVGSVEITTSPISSNIPCFQTVELFFLLRNFVCKTWSTLGWKVSRSLAVSELWAQDCVSDPHFPLLCVWLGRWSLLHDRLFLFVSGAISSRMPMNSCATFWTTCTWNSRAVSMVFPAHQFCRRILPCLQVTNAACKI